MNRHREIDEDDRIASRKERHERARSRDVYDAEPPLCQWFALCDHEATGTMPHPILGEVPICDRCRAKVEGLK